MRRSAWGRMPAAEWLAGLVKKKRKYRNDPVRSADGSVLADSQVEYRRQNELALMQKAGIIRDLRFHPVYVLVPKVIDEVSGAVLERAATYEADAEYTIVETGERVVEDTKSDGTEKHGGFVLKRKLLRHLFGIRIHIHKEGAR